tara:strand:- start:3615 stop:4220 length:606 start_codon:yes stop_codon:yes gene_type:complete
MASNEHSSLDNSQLHVPKDFSSAANNTVLTKNSAGSLEWQDDRLRTTHFVRVSGFLSKSTTDEYAPTYAGNATHTFDTVVTNPTNDGQDAVAQSVLYCLRDGYVGAFGGVIAINSPRSVEIRIYKGTPTDESSSGFALTQLGDTITEGGEGATTPNVFSVTSLSSSSSFSAGDVLIVTLKPTAASATTARLNSTVEVVYTA